MTKLERVKLLLDDTKRDLEVKEHNYDMYRAKHLGHVITLNETISRLEDVIDYWEEYEEDVE